MDIYEFGCHQSVICEKKRFRRLALEHVAWTIGLSVLFFGLFIFVEMNERPIEKLLGLWPVVLVGALLAAACIVLNDWVKHRFRMRNVRR